MPYYWLVDAGRFARIASSWRSPDRILKSAANNYRLDYWHTQPQQLQIWTEKDAVVGMIEPITNKYQVPLYSCKGYASLTLIYNAVQDFIIGKPVCIRYFGDKDPSGEDIPRYIEETMRDLNANAQHSGEEIDFEVVAVTDAQIKEYELPTRPTKPTDARSKNFTGESVELDAFDPNDLRKLVEDAIKAEVDGEAWDEAEKQEKADKKTLKQIVKDVTKKGKSNAKPKARIPH